MQASATEDPSMDDEKLPPFVVGKVVPDKESAGRSYGGFAAPSVSETCGFP